jgi:ribose transport system permease protein
MNPISGASFLGSKMRMKARIRRAFVSERFDLVGLSAVLLILCLIFSVLSRFFFTFTNMKALGVAVSYNAILAAAQTVVIVSGLIDLSFTSILAICGIAAQKLLLVGVVFPLVILGAMIVGAACGFVNAVICVAGGVNPLIATIGTGLAFRGLAFIWLDIDSMPYFTGTALNYIGNGTLFGMPAPLIISGFVIAAIYVLMRFTRFGSRVYAMGGSESATRLAGVSVRRLKTNVFVLSGVAAAIGGLLLTSLNGTAFPDAARGDELLVIAAVILGGTSLIGGRGSVIGTTLAVLVLGVMANGMNLLGVQAFWQVFLSGVVLILAVVVDEQRNRARQS